MGPPPPAHLAKPCPSHTELAFCMLREPLAFSLYLIGMLQPPRPLGLPQMSEVSDQNVGSSVFSTTGATSKPTGFCVSMSNLGSVSSISVHRPQFLAPQVLVLCHSWERCRGLGVAGGQGALCQIPTIWEPHPLWHLSPLLLIQKVPQMFPSLHWPILTFSFPHTPGCCI